MKKISFLLVLLLLFSSLGMVASADQQDSLAQSAGITPDSLLYPVDLLFEDIRLALTFDEEKKTELIASFAQERLAESELLVQIGEEDLAQETLERYEEQMQEALDRFEQIAEANEGSQDEDKLARMEKLGERIAKKQEVAIRVLAKLEEKASGNAKEVLLRVKETQVQRQEAIVVMVEKRHQLNNARQEFVDAKDAMLAAQLSGDADTLLIAKGIYDEKKEIFEITKEELSAAVEFKKEIVKITNEFKKGNDKGPEDKPVVGAPDEQKGRLGENKKDEVKEELKQKVSDVRETFNQKEAALLAEKIEKIQDKLTSLKENSLEGNSKVSIQKEIERLEKQLEQFKLQFQKVGR